MFYWVFPFLFLKEDGCLFVMKMLIIDNQIPYRVGTQKLLELRFPELITVCHDVDILSDYKYISTADILLLDPCDLSSVEQVMALLMPIINKGVQVIIYSTCVSENFLMDMISIGVKGCLMKNSSPSAFMQGISIVMKGERYIDSSLVPTLLKRLTDKKDMAEPSIGINKSKVYPEDILTSTEWTILKLFIRGQSNSEIAKELFLSESTVSQYMGKIVNKLEVPTRIAAAIKAVANGWVDISEYVY